MAKITTLLSRLQLGPDHDVAAYLTWITGQPALAGLPKAKVITLTQHMENMLAAAGGDTERARDLIWDAYKAAHPEEDEQGDILDELDSAREIREAGEDGTDG